MKYFELDCAKYLIVNFVTELHFREISYDLLSIPTEML